MNTRHLGKRGDLVSILGFGCMRLPVLDGDAGRIDEPEAIRMVRHAIDRGVNYIDTAYPYHSGKSELLVAKALKDGYREKVCLATKFPTWLLKEHADFDRLLDEQLAKLETDHIDYYLLHALDKDRWETLQRLDVFKAIEHYLQSGKVRHIGFSFHDDAATFLKIVDAYDWDFCQIQYNYMNEQYQAGTEGLRHAAQKGMGVIVMEPLLGGKLARRPPEAVARIWDEAAVQRTPAEWALRWVWDHPEVSLLLSGMSTMEQVDENLRLAGDAQAGALTDEERALISRARDAYQSLTKANCTACEYCMPCPFGVNIPHNFSIYNDAFVYDDLAAKQKQYAGMEQKQRASNCQKCGKCEKACPQHLPIRKLLEEADAALRA